MCSIENREKFVPAEVKLSMEKEFFVEQYEKNVKVRTVSHSSAESAPVTYKTQCFLGADLSPVKYSESLSLNIGSKVAKYKKERTTLPEIIVSQATEAEAVFHSELIIPVVDEFEMN